MRKRGLLLYFQVECGVDVVAEMKLIKGVSGRNIMVLCVAESNSNFATHVSISLDVSLIERLYDCRERVCTILGISVPGHL
jgi:hypothetical protein